MKKTSFLIITLFITFTAAFGQNDSPPVNNPPVIVETAFTNRGIYNEVLVQKKFKSAPKFGIFALSEVLGTWHRSKPDEYMVQGNITYEFAKGFNLMGGFHMASGIGVRPALGIMYTYAKPELLIVTNPRFYIDNIGNVEVLALVEYKPPISENWSFYSKVRGLYTFTADGGDHARSYLLLRAGLTYKEFSFGPAAHFDYYGPHKVNKNSVGGFITVALF